MGGEGRAVALAAGVGLAMEVVEAVEELPVERQGRRG